MSLQPFVPGRPTGAMDHVDEDPRPHVLEGTDVKVEPEKERREAWSTPTSAHTHQQEKAGHSVSCLSHISAVRTGFQKEIHPTFRNLVQYVLNGHCLILYQTVCEKGMLWLLSEQ